MGLCVGWVGAWGMVGGGGGGGEGILSCYLSVQLASETASELPIYLSVRLYFCISLSMSNLSVCPYI